MVGEPVAKTTVSRPEASSAVEMGGGHTGPMFEERPDIQDRLDEELIVWLTTVNAAGQPQTSPVWFLVDGESIVVYSLAGTPRTRNIAANPRVSLNLNSTASGVDVVIIEGHAEVVPDARPANEDEAYVAKYEASMQDLGMTAQSFAADYPVRIHVQPTRLRAS
jgi:PPOX class probable F420-dependent enzyme